MVLAVVILFALVTLQVAAQDKSSQVGKWQLDLAKSEFSPGAAPKSMTITVTEDTPKMLSWRVDAVADNGPFNYEWSGPEDGTMQPMMQDGKVMSQQSAKKDKDGAILRHGEDADGTFDARASLSADGNTLTDSVTMRDKTGKEIKGKAVFHRVAEAK